MYPRFILRYASIVKFFQTQKHNLIFHYFFRAIETIGGLELESDYPYDAKKETCNFNKTLSHVAVKGAVDLPKNETAMAQWLISNGPISIGKFPVTVI